jgi:hypothetical protein
MRRESLFFTSNFPLVDFWETVFFTNAPRPTMIPRPPGSRRRARPRSQPAKPSSNPHGQCEQARCQAHANTEAALSARPSSDRYDEEYFSRFDRDPAYIEAQKLFTFCGRIGWWLKQSIRSYAPHRHAAHRARRSQDEERARLVGARLPVLRSRDRIPRRNIRAPRIPQRHSNF